MLARRPQVIVGEQRVTFFSHDKTLQNKDIEERTGDGRPSRVEIFSQVETVNVFLKNEQSNIAL